MKGKCNKIIHESEHYRKIILNSFVKLTINIDMETSNLAV
jgi:hypothetical protein